MSHNFSVLRANLFKQQPLNAQVEVLHYVPDHNAYLGVAVSKRQTKTLQRPIDFAIYQVGEWRARLLNDAAPELGLVLSDAEKLVILNGGLPDRLVAVAEGKATARGWVTKRLAAVHAMYELLGAQKRGDYDAISHWANQLESALKVIDAGLSDIRKGYKRRIPNLGNDLRALKLFSRFAFKQIRDEPIGLTSMESPKWEGRPTRGPRKSKLGAGFARAKS